MIKCPLCGKLNVPNERHWAICCGVRTKEISLQQLSNQVEGQLLSYCKDPARYKERRNEAIEVLKSLEQMVSGRSFYDVGAGGGVFIDEARKRGWHARGNELSLAHIRHAMKEYNIELTYGDITDFRAPQEKFDAVVFWHSLEHCIDVLGALHKAWEYLTPRGVAVIALPINKDLATVKDSAHVYEFTEVGLRTTLRKGGFSFVTESHDLGRFGRVFFAFKSQPPNSQYATGFKGRAQIAGMCDIFDCKDVLYIGATKKRALCMDLFECVGAKVTILEIHPPNVVHYRKMGYDVVWGLVQKADKMLAGKKFDVVFWWHGPEHIPKEEIAATIEKLKNLTGKTLIVGCPWGVSPNDGEGDNPFQKHISTLYEEDLEKPGLFCWKHGHADHKDSCLVARWDRA